MVSAKDLRDLFEDIRSEAGKRASDFVSDAKMPDMSKIEIGRRDETPGIVWLGLGLVLGAVVGMAIALVDPTPQVEDDAEIEIRPEELKIDTYRATGAGGQNVNKTETAIRITHLPSGIVVSCQNERSQLQNRETAMRILKARLLEKRVLEQEAEQARERGEMRSADWGSQIRSYVLHPYTLVKDHRTGVEVGDPTRVLDGDIDVFIEAALSQKKPTGGGTPSAQ